MGDKEENNSGRDLIDPDELCFQLTIATFSIGVGGIGIFFALEMTVLSTLFESGSPLVLVLFAGIISIFASISYKIFLNFAGKFFKNTRSSRRLLPHRGKADLRTAGMLFILATVAFFLSYQIQKAPLENGVVPDRHLLSTLSSEEINGVVKVRRAITHVSSSSFLITGFSSLLGIYFRLKPQNECDFCHSKLEPDYNYCPECGEETSDLRTQLEFLKIKFRNSIDYLHSTLLN